MPGLKPTFATQNRWASCLSPTYETSVKRALWGGQFWTDGYYVATVGERGEWKVVERYVRNQGKPREELRQLKLF